MAYCVTQNQDGTLLLNNSTIETCSTGLVMLSKSDYEIGIGDYEVINAADATTAFTFGLSAYLVFWFVGYKARMAKQAVRAV